MRAQDLLGAVGIDKARVAILSANDANAYSAVTAEFSERVKKLGLRAK
jgi:coenzyme F420-reducing hydrogenase delta subunit